MLLLKIEWKDAKGSPTSPPVFNFEPKQLITFFKKMGQPRPLFCLFSVFSNKHYNFYVKKCPSSIWCGNQTHGFWIYIDTLNPLKMTFRALNRSKKVSSLFLQTNYLRFGREPWSSGYGKRLTFQRSWVRFPAPYTGWTFFTFICFKNCKVC